MVVAEVVPMSVWLVVAGAAVVVLVMGGSVTAALLAAATEVENGALTDAE